MIKKTRLKRVFFYYYFFQVLRNSVFFVFMLVSNGIEKFYNNFTKCFIVLMFKITKFKSKYKLITHHIICERKIFVQPLIFFFIIISRQFYHY